MRFFSKVYESPGAWGSGLFGSLDGTDDSARVANGQGVDWNVLGYYTSGTDDTVVSDGDTGQYADKGTYPYIVAYMNGLGIFQSLIPLLHIQGMACCIESAVGSNKHVVAKGDGRSVQDDAVHIAIEVFTHADIIAIVAIEGLLDEEVLSGLSQQFTKQLLPLFGTGRQ